MVPSNIEPPLPVPCKANKVKEIEVRKKQAARIAVVRVKALPTPRAENRFPPPELLPPIPNAPPSERCNMTVPIRATAMMRWITRSTVCMKFQPVPNLLAV